MSDNLQIYHRLKELAQEYFAEISVEWEAGSYSTTQAHKKLVEKCTGLKEVERTAIVNGMEKRGEKKQDFVSKGSYRSDPNSNDKYIKKYTVLNSGKQLSIEVGTFKASFDACKVFDYLIKFESLAKVSAKDKVKFIREEVREDVALSFNITVTKEMAALAACVDDGDVRPVLTDVHIDVDNQCAVASDAHILSVQPVTISELSDTERSNHRTLTIHKDVMKSVGTYCIRQYNDLSVTATKEDKSKTIYRSNNKHKDVFPNYNSVIPNVHPEGYIQLKDPKDVKALVAFLKIVNSGNKKYIRKVKVYGRSYEHRVYFCYQDDDLGQKNEVSFETEQAIKHSFYFGIDANRLLKVKGWAGGFWYTSPFHALIFDDKYADLYLIMPVMLEGYETEGLDFVDLTGDKYKSKLIPAAQRHGNTPQERQQPAPVQQQPKQPKANPIKPQQEVAFIIAMEKDQRTPECRYHLEHLADGNYQVREKHHDHELKAAIQSMAHYLIGKYELQVQCVKHWEQKYGTPKTNPDFSKLFPLPETEIAEMFFTFYEQAGISEIPDYPEAVVQSEEPATVVQPEPITEAEAQPETVSIRKQPASSKAEVRPTSYAMEIIPIIELETSEGTLVVAGESYFAKLYDEVKGEFRSEAAAQKFNEIDAFISDALILDRPLDIERIAEEVGTFMQQVEQAI